MNIIKTETGLAIKFPFALKDEFRAAFPSAKWNAADKQWEVGPRSETRLRQWAALAAPVVEEIEASDEVELAGAALARVENALARARSGKASADESRAQLEKINAMLAAAEAQLDEAIDQAAAAEKALETEKSALTAKLAAVVDLDLIKKQARVMSNNMVPADRQKKDRFEEARAIVKGEREKLKAAGFACAAINKLSGANVNRPDRDHPKNVLDSDWFDVWEVEQEA